MSAGSSVTPASPSKRISSADGLPSGCGSSSVPSRATRDAVMVPLAASRRTSRPPDSASVSGGSRTCAKSSSKSCRSIRCRFSMTSLDAATLPFMCRSPSRSSASKRGSPAAHPRASGRNSVEASRPSSPISAFCIDTRAIMPASAGGASSGIMTRPISTSIRTSSKPPPSPSATSDTSSSRRSTPKGAKPPLSAIRMFRAVGPASIASAVRSKRPGRSGRIGPALRSRDDNTRAGSPSTRSVASEIRNRSIPGKTGGPAPRSPALTQPSARQWLGSSRDSVSSRPASVTERACRRRSNNASLSTITRSSRTRTRVTPLSSTTLASRMVRDASG